jgi:hypothetical protein
MLRKFVVAQDRTGRVVLDKLREGIGISVMPILTKHGVELRIMECPHGNSRPGPKKSVEELADQFS